MNTRREMVTGSSSYDFIDSSIRDILVSKPKECHDLNGVIDPDTSCFRWEVLESHVSWEEASNNDKEKQFLPMDILVAIASECERTLYSSTTFNDRNIPKNIRGILKLEGSKAKEVEEQDCHRVIATLISLNLIESDIRSLTGKEHGRAPLLKDMIEMITVPISLAPLLRSLLLPNKGINLRNLLWHGFVASLPRHWFALSIVLILSLNKEVGSTSFRPSSSTVHNNNSIEGLNSLKNHKSFEKVLELGQKIYRSPSNFMPSLEQHAIESGFVPSSHKKLLHVTLREYSTSYPVTFAAIMGTILEHSLRLYWCEVNQREDKKIAKPGDYYVTLDGHGQREKHDIVLLPYLSGDEKNCITVDAGTSAWKKNKLIDEIGGPMAALLTDLFASPLGGPNIRASIAHGIYNPYLIQELEQMDVSIDSNEPSDDFLDLSYVLLSTFSLIISTKTDGKSSTNSLAEALDFYRPVFSYTATITRGIDNVMNSLILLQNKIKSESTMMESMSYSMTEKQAAVGIVIANLGKEIQELTSLKERILLNETSNDLLKWSSNDVFCEHESNKIFSECGASQALLFEVSTALASFLNDLETATSEINSIGNGGSISSRRRKQISRLFSIAQLNFDFYSFTIYIALLHLEYRVTTGQQEETDTIQNLATEKILFQAVRRSRMVVSTFSTSSNLDRGLKALDEYVMGKNIKAISNLSFSNM